MHAVLRTLSPAHLARKVPRARGRGWFMYVRQGVRYRCYGAWFSTGRRYHRITAVNFVAVVFMLFYFWPAPLLVVFNVCCGVRLSLCSFEVARDIMSIL